MWTKTLNVKFKGQDLLVQIWLHDDSGEDQIVRQQSMMNEYFLIEDIKFHNRDAVHDFIKYYPIRMAKAFLIREGYNSGAIPEINIG